MRGSGRDSGRRIRRVVLLGLGLVVMLVGGYVVGARLLGINFVGFLSRSGVAAIRAPDGFRVEVFAEGLQAPRFMARGIDGTVFVAEQGAGRVTALPDRDGDGRADEKITVAGGLQRPHSLAFLGADLLVGESDKISKLELGADYRSTASTVLIPDLPQDGVHTTKTVLVGTDGRVYVAMGSTCNVCREGDPRRAAVWVYEADGSGGRLFASGLRNAVGLAVNPATGEIWATNNGRDLWGDDRPPETLYSLRDGADYGWPRCHAGDLPDPDLAGDSGCAGVEAPLLEMQAHMAPLGLAFYEGDQFPEQYRDSLYIALHGSWNRSEPVGYKIMRLPLANGAVAGPAEDFASGWLAEGAGTVLGRPAGIIVGADGSLLVSDDKGGIVYRISYEK